MSKLIKNLTTFVIIILSIIMVIELATSNNAVRYIIAHDDGVNYVTKNLIIADSNNMIKKNNAYYCDILGGDITIIVEEITIFNILSIEDIVIKNGESIVIPLRANFLYNIKYIDNYLIIDDVQYKYSFDKIKIVFKNFGALGEIEQYNYKTFHNENFPISSEFNIVKGNVINNSGMKKLIPRRLTNYENIISTYIAIKDNKLCYIALLNSYIKNLTIDINDDFILMNKNYDSIEIFNPNGERIDMIDNKIKFEIDGLYQINLVDKFCITNILAKVKIPHIVSEPSEVPGDNPNYNGTREIIEKIIIIYVTILLIILLISFLMSIVLVPHVLILAKKDYNDREIVNIKEILKDNNQIGATVIKRNKLSFYLSGLKIIVFALIEFFFPLLLPLNAYIWVIHSNKMIEKMSDRKPDFIRRIKKKKLIICSMIYKMLIILGTLLFIVPGILIRINFGMYGNIIIDDEGGNTVITIFAQAMILMRGYRLTYFKLLCKQYFYIIVSILSCGLLLPWTLQYIITQKSLFYLSIYI